MTASATVLEQPVDSRPASGGGRRLLWVLVFAVAGALLGLAIGARLSTNVTAEVDLLVTPLTGNAFATTGGGNHLVDLETESHLPSSDAVLRRVAADGGSSPGIQVIRRRLTVSVVPNAEVLVIKYAAETPEQAREMAQRIAQATLDERVERAVVANTARLEIVAAKMADLEGRLVPGDELSPAQRKVLSERQVELRNQQRAALAPVVSPGRIIVTTMRGDGGAAQVRLLILGGCIVGAALLGVWAGRGSRRREEPRPG